MFQNYLFMMALPDGIGPLDQLIEKKIKKYKLIIPPNKDHILIIQTI